MNGGYSFKLSLLIHHWLFWLLIITLVGIFLRMMPSLLNAAWGVDFGIYYGLTNSFLQTKELINAYDGWGSSYQYFPVLYTLTGILHLITGIEVIQLLPKIAPIIGGLTIPIFYFIAKELMENSKIALLSSALLSVATVHVYQTSHAAPLTIGHFFMLLSLYFFIKYIENQKYFTPLLISTIFLILSHHFSTYFYLISITFMFFYYTLRRGKEVKNLQHILFYICLAATITFCYWGFIATPILNFITASTFLPTLLIISLFFILLFMGVLVIQNWKKRFSHFPKKRIYKEYAKGKMIIASFFLLSLLLLILTYTGIRGIYAPLTPSLILLSIPMVFVVSFAIAGLPRLRSSKRHVFIKGWIIGIFLSFLYSIISGEMFPERHLEYLITPLCMPAALSLYEFIEEYKESAIKLVKHSYTSSLIKLHRKKKIVIVSSVGILFISNMIVAYPIMDTYDLFDERVSNPCINCLNWMQGNVSNDSVIASDHRISMLIWAEGFQIPLGKDNRTSTIWSANNTSACLSELQRLKITYVVIDDIMYEKIVNVDIGYYYHFTNQSYNKFQKSPFELIYRNATYTDETIEKHWIEIYKINYSQINDNLLDQFYLIKKKFFNIESSCYLNL